MIEDFDGPEPHARGRGAMRVVSAALVFAAIVSWAVLGSPELRGPFATRHPSALFTPAPRGSISPAAALPFAPGAVQCLRIAQSLQIAAFVGGRGVIIERPAATPPPGAEVIQVVTSSGPAIAWSLCGHPPQPVNAILP